MTDRDLDSAVENIIELDYTHLTWGWDSLQSFRPTVPGASWYASASQQLDPTPAYGHDVAIVVETYRTMRSAFPMDREVSPYIYLIPREATSRTNGYTHVTGLKHADDWPESQNVPYVGVIGLFGKRIPPHPAFTRYLVAHEWGHVAEEWIKDRLFGHDRNREDQRLLDEYLTIRGVEPEDVVRAAGPGTWHKSIDEIFACDFRVMVGQVEPDYWPHPGIPHPRSLPAVARWWEDVLVRADERRRLLGDAPR